MKVLVADDELGLRNFISAVLKDEGHDVVTANDTHRTLQMLSAENPDLLILDMMMPGSSGQEVVRRIDEELGLRDMPMILMKPVGHQHWLPVDHLPADVLPKPFNWHGLVSTVNTMAQRRSAAV